MFDFGQVILDGFLGEEQLRGHLSVGVAPNNQPGDVFLSLR